MSLRPTGAAEADPGTDRPSLPTRLRRWARTARRDVVALRLAAGDARVPWYAKLVAASVAAYALSPIDLIPDFVPVLGYLDDVIIVPLGILLAIRLIPAEVMAELRAEADRLAGRPTSHAAAVAVVTVWLLVAAALGWWAVASA